MTSTTLRSGAALTLALTFGPVRRLVVEQQA